MFFVLIQSAIKVRPSPSDDLKQIIELLSRASVNDIYLYLYIRHFRVQTRGMI